jgi:hypothetical protein
MLAYGVGIILGMLLDRFGASVFANRAFSSEVATGSRQENASDQESRAPFRFHRNGKGSSQHQNSTID